MANPSYSINHSGSFYQHGHIEHSYDDLGSKPSCLKVGIVALGVIFGALVALSAAYFGLNFPCNSLNAIMMTIGGAVVGGVSAYFILKIRECLADQKSSYAEKESDTEASGGYSDLYEYADGYVDDDNISDYEHWST